MSSFPLVLLIFPIALLILCKDIYQLLFYIFVVFMGAVIGAIHYGNINLVGCAFAYNYIKEYARDLKLKHDRRRRIEFYDHDGYLCFDLEGRRITTNMKMQAPGSEKGIKIGLRVFDYQANDEIAITNLEESGI